jgi:hypothetical protein
MNQFSNGATVRQFTYFAIGLPVTLLVMVGAFVAVVVTQQVWLFVAILLPVLVGFMVGWRFVAPRQEQK